MSEIEPIQSQNKTKVILKLVLSLLLLATVSISYQKLKMKKTQQNNLLKYKYTSYYALEGLSAFLEEIPADKILNLMTNGLSKDKDVKLNSQSFPWIDLWSGNISSIKNINIILSCFSDHDEAKKLDCHKVIELTGKRIKFAVEATFSSLKNSNDIPITYQRDIERRFFNEE